MNSFPPTRLWIVGLALAGAGALLGCSDASNPLAPYEGDRPLTLLRVTQSFTPEIQWVGGRVAAVGVNRGSRAALDSTLVWLQESPADDIGSFVTLGQHTASDRIRALGGTPADSLTDGGQYTFWIAERSALDAGLDPQRLPAGAFDDTTFTASLVLRGLSGGDRSLGLQYRVLRDEKLLGSRFVVTWTPGIPLRRLAIRQAAGGGFTDLVWHVLIPDGEPGGILPPVVVGEVPPGAEEAVPFPEAGFTPATYTLWGVTGDWDGGFSNASKGYTFFRIFPNNFEE